jgi:hypothetical protein
MVPEFIEILPQKLHAFVFIVIRIQQYYFSEDSEVNTKAVCTPGFFLL